MLRESRVITSYDDVVYVNEHVDKTRFSFENETRGVSERFNKTRLYEKVVEFKIPGPGGLFQTIQSLVKTTYISGMIYVDKARRLDCVEFLCKSTLKKGVIYVELFDRPGATHSNI